MARHRRSVATNQAALPSPRPGLAAFAEVAKSAKAFRPAREVLRRVRAVPTIFPQLDHATRVLGWPVERVAVVHGESSKGKTTFALGLGLSFLQRQHMFCLVDAECTSPITWLESLFGPYADSGGFLAMRPTSYEETVRAVRQTAEGLAEQRDKGKLPKDTSALFVIDSIRKLVPKNIMDRIASAKPDDDSVDGYGGRAAQYRAALNAAWMDELVPLMHSTGCAILFVARETDDPNADSRARRFGGGWKVGGGKSLIYESSLVIRVDRGGLVQMGKGPEAQVLGERHRVDIMKTKLAAKHAKVVRCHFHTSNGLHIPEGFDVARDLLELAVRFEIVKVQGAWFKWGNRRWQGELKAVEKLTYDAALLAELDAEVRAQFTTVNPVEVEAESLE